MKQFTLRLDARQQRPVVALKNGLSALLDTGAYFPVWTDSEEVLVSGMGGTLVRKHVPFIGFGGTAYGNLYQVTLEVGGLIFPNMHIIVNDELELSYNLILSATMFQGLIYEIDDKNHKLNIALPQGESNVRNLKIEDKNGHLHVLCHSTLFRI